MKTILAVTTIAALYSCSLPRAIPAEMVSAELVKIDTAFRYNTAEQMLTWRDDNHVDYITYAPMNNVFSSDPKRWCLLKDKKSLQNKSSLL